MKAPESKTIPSSGIYGSKSPASTGIPKISEPSILELLKSNKEIIKDVDVEKSINKIKLWKNKISM